MYCGGALVGGGGIAAAGAAAPGPAAAAPGPAAAAVAAGAAAAIGSDVAGAATGSAADAVAASGACLRECSQSGTPGSSGGAGCTGGTAGGAGCTGGTAGGAGGDGGGPAGGAGCTGGTAGASAYIRPLELKKAAAAGPVISPHGGYGSKDTNTSCSPLRIFMNSMKASSLAPPTRNVKALSLPTCAPVWNLFPRLVV